MRRLYRDTVGEIITCSNLLKTALLLFLFFFNFNSTAAQIWKRKRTLKKIDSLELVINSDRESYKQELIDIHKLTAYLSIKLDSLTLELDSMDRIIDSMALIVKKTVKLDNHSDEKLSKNITNTYCPDDVALEQVKYLENCCCLIDQACPNETSADGLRIITEGYQMAVIKGTIVLGSCWDFINRVYNNAGYPQANIETIYKGKKGSKFQKPELLHAGDWVYHINYSYHNVEHSAIFICWENFDKRLAVTLSYVGQNRSVPGQYGTFDLSGVYNVMRPKKMN